MPGISETYVIKAIPSQWEGANADLRHYIPILARSSRCFARKIETLLAILMYLWMRITNLVLQNTATGSHAQPVRCFLLLSIFFKHSFGHSRIKNVIDGTAVF